MVDARQGASVHHKDTPLYHLDHAWVLSKTVGLSAFGRECASRLTDDILCEGAGCIRGGGRIAFGTCIHGLQLLIQGDPAL